MIVDSIDYSDKYNLVILTVEGEEFYISYDFYNDLMLQADDEISFDTYKDILTEDQFNKAKNFALSKISYSQKTSFEIIKLLRENDFDQAAIDKTMEFLDEYKLIDDELFVRSFVSDKHNISSWPKNKIKYALLGKKIDEGLINKYLDTIPAYEEYEKCLAAAKKKARDDYSNDNKQKVYRNLASKGFEFDLINRVMGELF